MNKYPFTQGPWKWNGMFLMPAVEAPDSQAVRTIVELGGDSGAPYWGSTWTSKTRQAEDAANLQLIEHAPMLFAALDRVMVALHQPARGDIADSLVHALQTLNAAAPAWRPSL